MEFYSNYLNKVLRMKILIKIFYRNPIIWTAILKKQHYPKLVLNLLINTYLQNWGSHDVIYIFLHLYSLFQREIRVRMLCLRLCKLVLHSPWLQLVLSSSNWVVIKINVLHNREKRCWNEMMESKTAMKD